MKVLIVDDKPENLYLLELILKGSGYITVSAKNGAEALGLARKDIPDLIITDILMPVMDGFTLCREFKKDEKLCNVPFIFYTATYTDPKDEEFALSLGADRFILKPQDPEEFSAIVKAVLKEAKSKDIQATHSPSISDQLVLKEYNEALVRKLEDKMLQTEQSEKEIRKYNIILLREIEERKAAEKALRESVERYHDLTNISPVGIFHTDENGFTTFVNPRWCQISGLSADEALGNGWLNVVHPDDREKLSKGWQESTRDQKTSFSDYRFLRPDGTIAWVMGQAIPERGSENQIVGYIGTITDITERKRVEKELIKAKELAEQSDKLKTEFLAQMSHEIRTPISIITGNVNLLKDERSDKINPEDQESFESIDLASRRIIRTIDLILNISELQAGTYKPLLKEIDINSIVLNKLINEFKLAAKNKGLDLIFKCEIKKSKVIADEYSITQIFANLIDNAIKYTKKGKIEIILTKNKDGNIVAEVKDTGIGINKEFLPHLFEPFVQEEHGYTRSYEGNGLGLALVKKYCDINNISIEVESEKNVGSTFRIIFN